MLVVFVSCESDLSEDSPHVKPAARRRPLSLIPAHLAGMNSLILVVSLNEARGCSVPARLTVPVCLTLACAVSRVDFAGRRKNQKRVAVKMYVRVSFNLLHGFDYGRLPSKVV